MKRNINTKFKILIIDDDTDIFQALEVLLSGECYQVFTEEKGENIKVLKGRAEYLPDVILLDVYMPGKDGQYIEKIKEEQFNKNNTDNHRICPPRCGDICYRMRGG